MSAGLLALVLLAELALVVRTGVLAAVPATPPPQPPEYSNIQALGLSLFSTYLVPFELTSLLLLVAMIGAVVLARGRART